MTEPASAASAASTALPRAGALARRLADWPRRRVTLVELWSLFDEIDPSSRTSAQRRSLLANDLSELAAAGAVTMPSERSFDRSQQPPLPRFITVPVRLGPDPERQPGRPIVWHPELSWVPSANLTPAQRDTLARVDRWLHGCADPLVVPVRERSWEVFDDEKAIDRLETTSLFSQGRLSLELLRCRRAMARFVWERVGDGGCLLVVENSDTFDSLVTALRAAADRQQGGSWDGYAPEHRVGIVGWGAGAAFEASVRSIASLPVTTVRYFGDLDEAGLRIPAAAAVTASAGGLPPVLPAVGLYDALLSIGRPQPGQRKVPAGSASVLCDWLDERHRADAEAVLSAGQRMAQEAVGLAYLLRQVAWRADLS